MEVAGGARQSTRCRSTGPVRDVGRGLGCQFLFIKIGLEGLSPPQVVLGRLLTGSAALVTVSLVSGQRPPREPTVGAPCHDVRATAYGPVSVVRVGRAARRLGAGKHL